MRINNKKMEAYAGHECTYHGLLEKITEQKGGTNKKGETYSAKTQLSVLTDDCEYPIKLTAQEGTDEQRQIRALGNLKKFSVLQITVYREYKQRQRVMDSGATWIEVVCKETLIEVKPYEEKITDEDIF